SGLLGGVLQTFSDAAHHTVFVDEPAPVLTYRLVDELTDADGYDTAHDRPDANRDHRSGPDAGRGGGDPGRRGRADADAHRVRHPGLDIRPYRRLTPADVFLS